VLDKLFDKFYFFWTVAILALFMHGNLPLMLPLSVISLGITFILFFVKNKKNIPSKKTMINFVFQYKIYLLLVFVFFIYVVLNWFNWFVIKELIYALYITVLFYALFLYAPSRILLNKIKQVFSFGYLFFLFLLVLVFYTNLILHGYWFGEAIASKIDYNYMALAFISGLVVLLYVLKNVKNHFLHFWGAILLFLTAVPVLFSGSRRGIVVIAILHIAMLVYFIGELIHKNKNRTLIYYFVFLVSLLFFSLTIFYSNSSTWRAFIVNDYFTENASTIKHQYTNIMWRYATITRKNPQYKDIFDENWETHSFSGKNVLDNYIFNKEKKSFYKFYENRLYDLAYDKLKNLISFSESYSHFLKILPDEYKSSLKKTNIDSLGIENLPYYYPIPYFEKNFLILFHLSNLYLINHPFSSNFKYKFIVENSRKKNTCQVCSYILLMQNTQSVLRFNVAGIDTNRLKINFRNLKGDKQLHFTEENKLLKNNQLQKTIRIKTAYIKSGLYVWELNVNPNLSDTFVLSNIQYSRKLLSNKYFKPIPKNEVKRYIGAQNRRKNQYETFYQKYLLSSKDLVKKEQDSLKLFIKNINFLDFDFTNYGHFSNLIAKTDTNWQFICPNNNLFSRAYIKLPVLNGSVSHISLNVQSSQKPKMYIKRFPENVPHFLKVKNQLKISSINSNFYHIDFQFKIDSSASAFAALVVGVPNSMKGDTFEISNLKYKLLHLKDTIATKYQYSFLSPFIQKSLRKQNLVQLNSYASKYLEFEKNIKEHDGLMTSRFDRWQFAWLYFKNQPFYKQLLGCGFNYLKIYPTVFNNPSKEVKNDYPHNPIISSFLYSGIMGGLLYVYFLVLSFLKYWKLRKELELFAILYILTFAFTFFSGNSHFSVPAFTILSLIPFAFEVGIQNKSLKNNKVADNTII